MALPHAVSTSSSFSQGDVEAVGLNVAIIVNRTGEGAEQPSRFSLLCPLSLSLKTNERLACSLRHSVKLPHTSS